MIVFLLFLIALPTIFGLVVWGMVIAFYGVAYTFGIIGGIVEALKRQKVTFLKVAAVIAGLVILAAAAYHDLRAIF
jgi:hypothetical protein